MEYTYEMRRADEALGRACAEAEQRRRRLMSHRERLLDDRNILMNGFGYGPFRDGRTRDAIADIDRRLAALT